MPFHYLTESELRDHCKRTIEGLERWLRRLIDDKLRAAYGPNYVDEKDDKGNNILNSDFRKSLKKKLEENPGRYARPIDAAFLDDEIDIICKPELYEKFFRAALSSAFPEGAPEARTFLKRLIKPRNALSHANALSVRCAEQVTCYSNDVIDALKSYYQTTGMAKMYNVPTIVRLTDSLGHDVHESQILRNNDGYGALDFKDINLWPGDVLSIEIEVDPSFDSESFDISWTTGVGEYVKGQRFRIEINNKHVRETFYVNCNVKSHNEWHKLGNYDDYIEIKYKVLPPP